MFPKVSAKDGGFRIVIEREGVPVVIEEFDREEDARDYFEKATAEDSFLFQLDAAGEYSVSLEVPETAWKTVAKRLVLSDERSQMAHPSRIQRRRQQAR